jgi:GTP cyclohydrolase IA
VLSAPPAIGNGHGPYPGAVTAGHTSLDFAAAGRAVANLLAALGVPPGSETADGSPRRVAATLAELLTAPAFEFTVFPKLARVVQWAAAGRRLQEEMGQAIASFLEDSFDCAGAGVILACEHRCVTACGARAHRSDTITVALREVPALRSEFLKLAAPGGGPR